jgi:hypothetical protein
MAYDRKSLRVSWIFSVASTSEIAFPSLHIADGQEWDPLVTLAAMDQEVADGLAGAMAVLLSYGSFGWGSYSSVTGIKASPVGTNGKLLGPPSVWSVSPSEHGTTEQIIPQASVVISMSDGGYYTKSNRGRLYLPHCMLTQVAGHAECSDATRTSATSHAVGFLQTVNQIFNPLAEGPGVITIMSQKRPSVIANYAAVGRRTDIQRRRADRLDDTKSWVVIPA